MSTRKSAIEKAIDALEAKKKIIDLAIAELRATNEKKALRPRRVVAAEGLTK